MSSTRNILVISALAISTYAFGATPAQAELPRYAVKDLGTFGGVAARAADLNDAGQVTGGAEQADGATRAFLYDDGELRDIHPLADISFGVSINAAGQIAGESGVSSSFKYSAGLITDLGVLIPNGYSSAAAINNRGQVAGYAFAVPPSEAHATIYTGGRLKDIGKTGASSAAYAINDAGDVAGRGTFSSAPGLTRSFLYTGGKVIDLMPGRNVFLSSSPRILNNAGQLTGAYWVGEGERRGFIYHQGAVTTFGPLKGGAFTLPTAINRKGHVTGTASNATQLHAFIYANGRMNDLGTLGGDFSIGDAINEWDEVTGSSNSRAFVFAKGRMINLHVLLGTLGFGEPIESYGVDINNSGQVIGNYDVSFPDDEFLPLRTRAFIATPIPLLFSRLTGTLGTVSSNKNLVTHLQAAQAAYTTQKLKAACDAFYAFELEARSLQTRGRITASVADNLVRRAQDIATPIGCNLTTPL